MIFSFVFSLIFENQTFFPLPNFWRKMFFGYFKSQKSKCYIHREILKKVFVLKMHFR